MTEIAITHTWQQLTTPCVIQVQGGRVGIFIGGTPNTSSPKFVLQTLDFWEMTTSDALWIRTLDVAHKSKITHKAL